jgi:hypothetical protein
MEAIMPLSVRLNEELESRINEYCRQTGVSKSHVVQQGVAEYLDAHALPTLHEMGKDLFPTGGNRRGDASETHARRYREYVRAKRAGR